jgi:hypothetical protein
LKFKKGDRVNIIGKSYGRNFKDIDYNHGIISGIISIYQNGVYLINNDYFLECDLIKFERFFTDKDFEL